MASQQRFTIEEGAYALDGGSISLLFRNEDGKPHRLVLVQHRIPMSESDPRMPGRLYLNGRLIQIRSPEEIRLISGLKTALILPANAKVEEQEEGGGPVHVIGEDIADFMAATRLSPKKAIQHLVDSLIQFVESDEYVSFARQFDGEDSA